MQCPLSAHELHQSPLPSQTFQELSSQVETLTLERQEMGTASAGLHLPQRKLLHPGASVGLQPGAKSRKTTTRKSATTHGLQ
eukprot:6062162-Amphidinium_carterae.1